MLGLWQLLEEFPAEAVITVTFGGYDRNKTPWRIKYYSYPDLKNPLLRADLLRQVVYDKFMQGRVQYAPIASGLFEDRD